MERCKAILILGDDYGDNDTTIRCQLPEGHAGPHQETFRTIPKRAHNVNIIWVGDDTDNSVEVEDDAVADCIHCGIGIYNWDDLFFTATYDPLCAQCHTCDLKGIR